MNCVIEVYFLHINRLGNGWFQSLFMTQHLPQRPRFFPYFFSSIFDMLAMTPHSHKMAAFAPGIMSLYNHLQIRIGSFTSQHISFNSGRKNSAEAPEPDFPLFLISQKIPLAKTKQWMKISKQPTRTATAHVRYATQPLFPSRVQCQRPRGGTESLISGRFTSNYTTKLDITSWSQQSFLLSRNVISQGVPTKYSMYLLELKPEIKIWFLLWPLEQRTTMETDMRED